MVFQTFYITFYVNKSQVYSRHLKMLMTIGTNKPKKKESVQDFVVFNYFLQTLQG